MVIFKSKQGTTGNLSLSNYSRGSQRSHSRRSSVTVYSVLSYMCCVDCTKHRTTDPEIVKEEDKDANSQVGLEEIIVDGDVYTIQEWSEGRGMGPSEEAGTTADVSMVPMEPKLLYKLPTTLIEDKR